MGTFLVNTATQVIYTIRVDMYDVTFGKLQSHYHFHPMSFYRRHFSGLAKLVLV